MQLLKELTSVGITSRKQLVEHLEWAWLLELSTLPPYLTALWSIEDASSDAYRLVKSVALEEMLHMLLVTNLYNSVGGNLARSNVKAQIPRYPGSLPHAAQGGPWIQLSPASVPVFANVFALIEQPADEPNPQPQPDRYTSIAQFYKAIEDGFRLLKTDIKKDSYQIRDAWFGGGGGEVVVVTDLDSALRAIREIVEQGEGARPFESGTEDEGELLGYGQRQDGTYGPIYGRQELSHYAKFMEVVNGNPALGTVFPMAPNPDPAMVEVPKGTHWRQDEVRALARLFDDLYTLLINALVDAFSREEDRELFFTGAVPIMHSALPPIATLLMAVPLDPAAPDSVGLNAGPGFRYGQGDGGREPNMAWVARALERLATRCASGDVVHIPRSLGPTWASTLLGVAAVLQDSRS